MLTSLRLNVMISDQQPMEIIPAYSSNYVTVCFCTDSNYAPLLSVALYSLTKNSDPNTNYDIIVLHNNLSESHINKLNQSVIKIPSITIRFFNVNSVNTFSSVRQLFTTEYMTVTAYYRLFLSSFLVNYSKVLYLDCDILVLQNIDELYNTDLKDNMCAAVIDYGIANIDYFFEDSEDIKKYLKDILSIDNVRTYFNSGVLVLNLEKIRQNKLEEKMLEVAKINNKYFHDQNVLNSVLKNNCLLIDYKWNYLWTLPNCRNYDKTNHEEYQKYEAARKRPAIIHYTSTIKPYNNNVWEWHQIFWDYALETPFRDELIEKIFTSLNNNHDIKIQTIKKENSELKRLNEALSRDNEIIQHNNSELEKQQIRLRTKYEKMKNSISFKIGSIITFIPRKITTIIHKHKKASTI